MNYSSHSASWTYFRDKASSIILGCSTRFNGPDIWLPEELLFARLTHEIFLMGCLRFGRSRSRFIHVWPAGRPGQVSSLAWRSPARSSPACASRWMAAVAGWTMCHRASVARPRPLPSGERDCASPSGARRQGEVDIIPARPGANLA